MGKQTAQAKEVYWCANFNEDVNGLIQKMINLELHIKFVIREVCHGTEQRVLHSHLIQCYKQRIWVGLHHSLHMHRTVQQSLKLLSLMPSTA